MGGYQLNQYRNTTVENGNPHGINVAHDDPDANEFDLAVGNGFAFHPGNYTNAEVGPGKVTRDHSTIIVDDKGQAGEGSGYSQPIGNEDMTQFSYLTGWKTDDKGHVIIEGEAGPAYRGQSGPDLKKAGNKLADAVLKTYRRTAIWMPKEYILILDNIVSAGGPHKISWHGTTPVSQIADGKGTATTETGTAVPGQCRCGQVRDRDRSLEDRGHRKNDPGRRYHHGRGHRFRLRRYLDVERPEGRDDAVGD
jgi:hypothetical protein